jgi:hypothetical protein
MFTLEVFKGDLAIHEVLSQVEGEFEGLDYAIDENGESLDGVKWYDHEIDMKELSKRFPEVIFKLHGKGEENDDMWNKYFKNGKMQSCYAFITYESFNENKLVE